MHSSSRRNQMWWQSEVCREAIAEYLVLMQHGLPAHRFESSIERHKVNGQWIIAVAFVYIDCELNPGLIAIQIITEEIFTRSVLLAGIREHDDDPASVARQLHGVLE